MSAWHECNTFFRIILIAVLPLFLMNMDAKALSNRKPVGAADAWSSKTDVERLYDAYRRLLNKESYENVKNIQMFEANTSADIIKYNKENDFQVEVKLEPVQAHYMATDPQQLKERQQVDSQKKLKPVQINFDATDEHEFKERQHLNGKKLDNIGVSNAPVANGLLLMEMAAHAGKHPAPSQPANCLNQVGATECRAQEPNCMFAEYIKSWKQFVHHPLNNYNQPVSSSAFQTARTNALNELFNMAQRLEQTNAIQDITTKLMQNTLTLKPIKPSTCRHRWNTNKVLPQSQQQDDFDTLLRNIEPRIASKVFTLVANEMRSLRAHIKVGQFYNEYKKLLLSRLKEHISTRDARTGFIAANDFAADNNNGNMQPLVGSRFKEKIKAALNKFCANGGSKPYFLPNSKNRQLLWNEVPLIQKYEANVPANVIGNATEPVTNQTKSMKAKPNVPLKGQSEPNKNNSVLFASTEIYPGVQVKHIKHAINAIQKSSFHSLYDEYHKQMEDLHKMLKAKQLWWHEALGKANQSNIQSQLKAMTGLIPHLVSIHEGATLNEATFPEVLTKAREVPANAANTAQYDGMLEHMANQLNLSPVELAQRITGASYTPDNFKFRYNQAPASSPTQPAGAVSSNNTMQDSVTNKTPIINNTTPVTTNVTAAPNLAPILDNILHHLQQLQESKKNESTEYIENPLPCCFADPTDGSPCSLLGSWESSLLGVRINIKSSTEQETGSEPKLKCAQPKLRSSYTSRIKRQCVKINSTQIRELTATPVLEAKSTLLNITIQETVPPRAHDMIENTSDWTFAGHVVSIVGGPLSMSCRKTDTNLLGAFLGYCRTCGCVDTIFGSWTFCMPSRDCQDITTSIIERRDMLRRYSMDSKRRDRYKEHIYKTSQFAKAEKQRLHAEQLKLKHKE